MVESWNNGTDTYSYNPNAVDRRLNCYPNGRNHSLGKDLTGCDGKMLNRRVSSLGMVNTICFRDMQRSKSFKSVNSMLGEMVVWVYMIAAMRMQIT